MRLYFLLPSALLFICSLYERLDELHPIWPTVRLVQFSLLMRCVQQFFIQNFELVRGWVEWGIAVDSTTGVLHYLWAEQFNGAGASRTAVSFVLRLFSEC